MMPKRKTLLYRTLPFLVFGLLAFILYLVFFVNIGEMVATLKQTSLPIYSVALVATLIEVGLFSLAWRYFLKPLSATLSFKRAFLYTWASSFIDLLIPAESVSGEISRIYFVTHDGVEAGKAVASVVTQRILGTFLIVGTLVSGALYLLIFQIPFPSLVQSLIYFVVAAATVFLCLISIVWFKENWTLNLIDKIIVSVERVTRGRWNLNAWRDQARKDTRTFYESIRSFSANPKKLIAPIAFSALSWFFSILVYYLVFAALGHATLNWAILIVVYSLVVALKAIPVGIPWEFGVTEIAMTTLFAAFLGPAWLAIGAAATILIRIVSDLFRFVVGFGAIQWIGIKSLAESETPVGQQNET
jgi:uncharacterized protein (TIRG00374 family)